MKSDKLELDVIIEKLSDDIIIPVDVYDAFLVRSDGVLLNGELHLWEEILTIQITNRKLLNEIKENKCYICNCGKFYYSSQGKGKCIDCLAKEAGQEGGEK